MLEKLLAEIPKFAPGHSLGAIEELHGGVSADAFKFHLEGPNPRTLVARVPHPDSSPQREFKILELIASLDLPAPKPVHLSEDFLILEWLEGAPLLSPKDPLDYATQVAGLMVRIHAHAPDIEPLPWENEAPSHEPDESLRETEVRARLTELEVPAEMRRLRHGDLWPGNLIWQDEKLVGAIDWEECCLGHPLEDVSITRLDLLWVVGEDAMNAFTETYGRLRPFELDSLPYFDLKASLRPMGYLHHWTAEYPKLGRPDITLDSMTQAHNWFVEQALRALA